jgi:alpha-tubulin suppressor-like RCC1 family protein
MTADSGGLTRWCRECGRVLASIIVGLVAVVPLAMLPMSEVGAASASATGGPATASGTAAVHWGSFFGNGTARNDMLVSPTPIALPGKVVQVATSNSTQYALLANGSVYAWGLGGDGELGNGGTADSYTVPVKVAFPAGVKIASLPIDAMPYNTGLAIDSTGQPWGWGDDSAGQLCLGNTSKHTTPVKIPLSHVTAMAGAGDHALYFANGTLDACGGNQDGDLGDGSSVPSSKAVPVEALAGRHIRVLVASYHDSGALLADGHYFDWGYDAQGQLGDGKIGVSSSVPVLVHLPLTVTQVVQGGSYSTNGQTLVMLSDGSLRSWGDNQSGQLGNGDTITQASPIAFDPPTGVAYELLASGASTSYAVSTNGDVYSWGGNANGQIGNGGTHAQLIPVLVESGASNISATALDVATGPSTSTSG